MEELAPPTMKPMKKESGPVVIRQTKGEKGEALVDVIASPDIQGGRREILVSPKEAAEHAAARKRAGEKERAAAEARVLAKEKTDFKGAMKAVMLEVAAKPADQKLLDELQDHIIERAKAKSDADKAAEMRNTMKEVLEADAEMEKTVESILEMAGYEDSIINDAARADILGNKTEILKRALAARDPKLKHPPEFATALDLAIGERSKAFFQVLKETVGTAAEVRQQRLEQAAEAAQTALAALNEMDGRGRLTGKDKEKRNRLGEDAHAAAAEWLRLASHSSFERTAADLKAEAERLGIDESIPEKNYTLVAPEKGVSVKRAKPTEPIVDATRADLKYSQDPYSYGKAQEFTVDTSAEVDPLLDRPQRRMTMQERFDHRMAESRSPAKQTQTPLSLEQQFFGEDGKEFEGDFSPKQIPEPAAKPKKPSIFQRLADTPRSLKAAFFGGIAALGAMFFEPGQNHDNPSQTAPYADVTPDDAGITTNSDEDVASVAGNREVQYGNLGEVSSGEDAGGAEIDQASKKELESRAKKAQEAKRKSFEALLQQIDDAGDQLEFDSDEAALQLSAILGTQGLKLEALKIKQKRGSNARQLLKAFDEILQQQENTRIRTELATRAQKTADDLHALLATKAAEKAKVEADKKIAQDTLDNITRGTNL